MVDLNCVVLDIVPTGPQCSLHALCVFLAKGEVGEEVKRWLTRNSSSGCDFLIGKANGEVIKWRKIPRGHLKGEGSSFTAFLESLHSVSWCGRKHKGNWPSCWHKADSVEATVNTCMPWGCVSCRAFQDLYNVLEGLGLWKKMRWQLEQSCVLEGRSV